MLLKKGGTFLITRRDYKVTLNDVYNTINTKRNRKKMLIYSPNDMGNAKRFLFVFKGEIFYNRQQKCWYYNAYGKWVVDDIMMIELYAQATMQLYETASKNSDASLKKHASQSLNCFAIKNLLDMAKANAIISYSEFDNKPYLLNVQNGIVNLKTGRLKKYVEDYYPLRQCNAFYTENTNLKAPVFEKFLNDIFQNNRELIDYIQVILGYAITGEKKEECFFIFKGSGGNGKSKLIDILRYVLGDYTTRVPIQSFLSSSGSRSAGRANPELIELNKRRLCFASEFKETDVLNDALIKSITGDSTLSARQLYGNQIELNLDVKLFIDTNVMPLIDNFDYSMERRVIVIPFNKEFKGKDRDLDLLNKLKREKTAILKWLVEGAVKYYKDGLPEMPDIVSKESRLLSDSIETVDLFLKDCVIREAGTTVLGNDLYDLYKKYCYSSFMDAVSRQKFSQKMAKNGVKKCRRKQGVIYENIRIIT